MLDRDSARCKPLPHHQTTVLCEGGQQGNLSVDSKGTQDTGHRVCLSLVGQQVCAAEMPEASETCPVPAKPADCV